MRAKATQKAGDNSRLVLAQASRSKLVVVTGPAWRQAQAEEVCASSAGESEPGQTTIDCVPVRQQVPANLSKDGIRKSNNAELVLARITV